MSRAITKIAAYLVTVAAATAMGWALCDSLRGAVGWGSAYVLVTISFALFMSEMPR